MDYTSIMYVCYEVKNRETLCMYKKNHLHKNTFIQHSVVDENLTQTEQDYDDSQRKAHTSYICNMAGETLDVIRLVWRFRKAEYSPEWFAGCAS